MVTSPEDLTVAPASYPQSGFPDIPGSADILLIRHGQSEPRVEPDLREVHLGDWEGGEYRQRVAERDPIVRQVFEQERWEVIPGAETSASLAARVRAAIERLAAAHAGDRLAIFTHGGVIAQTLALASGSRPFAFLSADNASISQI